MAPLSTVPANPPPTALAWLWLRPRAVPDLLRAPELGPIVWQALIRDGILRHVWGEVAIPADLPETPDVRATAAWPLVPPRGVVGRAAAVWVHAGGPRPARIDVLVPARARRPDPHPQRVPHECALPAADVVGVGPLRVTTIERTAVDVARWTPAREAGPLLERLARRAGLDPRSALRTLDSLAGYRGTRHARAALVAVPRTGRGPQPGETVLAPCSKSAREPVSR